MPVYLGCRINIVESEGWSLAGTVATGRPGGDNPPVACSHF